MRAISLASVLVVAGGMSLATADATAPAGSRSSVPSDAQKATIRLIQCHQHIKQIGLALNVYATNHDFKYPADLGELLVAQKLDMSLFVCPAAPSALPADWQKMALADQAKWVNAHSDYIFLAAGKKMTMDSGDVLLYEKYDDHGGTVVNVCFGDAHVELLRLADLHKRFGAAAGTERTTTRIAPIAGAAPAIPLITLDQAKAIAAQFDLSTLRGALEGFEIDNGRYPTTSEGLDALVHKPAGNLPSWAQLMDHLPLDPWGHPYVYVGSETGKSKFKIFSAGPDGKPGTSDDVLPDSMSIPKP